MRVLLVAILLMPILVQGASDAANDIEYSEMIYGQEETSQEPREAPPAYLDILAATSQVHQVQASSYGFLWDQSREDWFDNSVTFDVKVAEEVDRNESRFPGIRVYFSVGGSDFMVQTTDGWGAALYRFEELPFRSAWQPFTGLGTTSPGVSSTGDTIQMEVDLVEFSNYFDGRDIAMENVRVETFKWVGADKALDRFDTDCTSLESKTALAPCVGKFHDSTSLPDLPLHVQPTYVIASGVYPLGDLAWWKGATVSNQGTEPIRLDTSFRAFGPPTVPVGSYPLSTQVLPGETRHVWAEVDYMAGPFGVLQFVWGEGNLSEPFRQFSKYGTGVGGYPPQGASHAGFGLGPSPVPESYAATKEGDWFNGIAPVSMGSHLRVGPLGFTSGVEYPDHFIWEMETTVAPPTDDGSWSMRLASVQGGEAEYVFWAREPHGNITILDEGIVEIDDNGARLTGPLQKSNAVNTFGLTIRSEVDLGALQFVEPLKFSTHRPVGAESAAFEVERFDLEFKYSVDNVEQTTWDYALATILVTNLDGTPPEVTYTIGNRTVSLQNASGALTHIWFEDELEALMEPYGHRFSSTENPYLQLSVEPERSYEDRWSTRDAEEAPFGLAWVTGPLLAFALLQRYRDR